MMTSCLKRVCLLLTLKKGKYSGCNWEMVKLEVVQTCPLVPKEIQRGRMAGLHVTFLLSSVPSERLIG